MLAVALSLVSTNDYVLTKPGTTNIIGVGMGEVPAYAFLRDEDISFLREAYAERLDALHPSTNFVGDSFIEFPQGQPIPVDSFPYASALGVSLLWPESFETNDIPWGEYSHIVRGDNPSYVARDFALIRGTGTPIDCGDDWTLRPPDGTVRDLRKSYLAYLSSAGSRYRPPETLHTNAVYRFGYMSFDVITNGYHNLDYAHTIVTPPQDGVGTVSNRLYLTIRSAGYSATYNYASYTYDGRELRYESGFKTAEPYDISSESLLPAYYPGLPLRVSQLSVTVQAAQHLGWKRTGATEYTLAASFNRPGYKPLFESRNWYKSNDVGDGMTVWCDQITESNITYCSNISVVLAFGFRWSSTETRSSTYDAADMTTTNFAKCCYGTLSPTISRLPPRSSDPFAPVVFTAAADLDGLIASVMQHFGEPVESLDPVYPDTSSVPHTTQTPLSAFYGRHAVNNNIDLVWARVIFLFDRDFHAKVIKQ